MEAIQSKQFTLKQVLKDNWCSFLDAHHSLVSWYAAYNVWKVINCREPDGLGYATFACPIHPSEFQRVPHSCKSRFCSICAKVRVEASVTRRPPHSPVRAEFPHTVPRFQFFLPNWKPNKYPYLAHNFAVRQAIRCTYPVPQLYGFLLIWFEISVYLP